MMNGRVVRQFIHQAHLQAAPLTSDFTQVVSLLPAQEAVGSCILLLLCLGRLGLFGASQFRRETVQQVGDVIVELLPRQCVGRGQLGVSLYGLSPGLEDCCAARGEVTPECAELLLYPLSM